MDAAAHKIHCALLEHADTGVELTANEFKEVFVTPLQATIENDNHTRHLRDCCMHIGGMLEHGPASGNGLRTIVESSGLAVLGQRPAERSCM